MNEAELERLLRATALTEAPVEMNDSEVGKALRSSPPLRPRRRGLVSVAAALAVCALLLYHILWIPIGVPAPAQETGRIAYSAPEGKSTAIFTIDPAGGSPAKLFGAVEPIHEFAWLPGRKTLLVCAEAPQVEHLGLESRPVFWTAKAEGGGPVRLKSAADIRGGISQDGSRVVLGDESGYIGSLFVIDPHQDASKELKLGFFKTFEPSWSPDGKKLVFWGAPGRKDAWGTYVVHSNGTGCTRLARELHFPTYTPDGRTIVGVEHDAMDRQRPRKLFALDVETKRLREIADDATWWVREFPFRISPDGKRIAYRREPDDLVVVDLDGSNKTALDQGMHPTWSPDGRQIAFQKETEKDPEIWVIEVSTKKSRRLVAGSHPTWSR